MWRIIPHCPRCVLQLGFVVPPRGFGHLGIVGLFEFGGAAGGFGATFALGVSGAAGTSPGLSDIWFGVSDCFEALFSVACQTRVVGAMLVIILVQVYKTGQLY